MLPVHNTITKGTSGVSFFVMAHTPSIQSSSPSEDSASGDGCYRVRPEFQHARESVLPRPQQHAHAPLAKERHRQSGLSTPWHPPDPIRDSRLRRHAYVELTTGKRTHQYAR